eukprot:3289890-Pleurochrysis_carterae.AAC.3
MEFTRRQRRIATLQGITKSKPSYRRPFAPLESLHAPCCGRCATMASQDRRCARSSGGGIVSAEQSSLAYSSRPAAQDQVGLLCTRWQSS